jgi:hypothetical protein
MSVNDKTIDGLELINRVKLLMKYDMSKTLHENILEQSVIGAPNQGSATVQTSSPGKSSEEPKEVNKEVWPIPGYRTYYTPTSNSVSGGRSYQYFPLDIESTIKLWEFATPEDFPELLKLEKGDFWWKKITAQHLNKILPAGTVRNFSINGIQYLTSLTATDDSKGYWVFKGYLGSNGQYYQSPDPEEYKNEWDKFVEKYGTITQVVLSVLAAIVIEVLTAGTGTALAVKLLYEVMVELAINIPIALHELKKGDNFGAGLSIIFSFLPFLNTRLLGLGKISKNVSEEMAKKLASANITDGAGLARFYDNLETDDEKYLLSMVLKQSPEVIEKSFKDFLENIFKDPKFDKKILRKIAFKDRLWWKDAGMQVTAALSLIALKLKYGNSFSQQEYKRMNDFVVSVFKEMGEDEGQKFTAEVLQDTVKTESFVKIAMADTLNKDTKLLMKDVVENLPYNPNETVIKLMNAKRDSLKKSKIDISPELSNIYKNINLDKDTVNKDTVK